jgi:hypothetical protein
LQPPCPASRAFDHPDPFSAGKLTARRRQRRLTERGQPPLGGEPILHVASLGTTTFACELADRLKDRRVADLSLEPLITFGLLPKLAHSLHWTPPGLNY